jgi:NhaA family Na+:H+ antiporter
MPPHLPAISERSAGLLLVAAAGAALIVANGPLAPAYFAALHVRLGPLSVLHWIDDALMALFFLLVGLEIKRAFLIGALARLSDRILPVIAALAGMAVPAALYLMVAAGVPGLARGWAIPAATDIAFAVGVVALLGSRVPPSLRLLLVTIAIVDDLGAVLIIALGYTERIDLPALLAAAGPLAVMLHLNRRGVVRLSPYLLLGLLLWLLIHRSGVHATIAGILTALAIPLRTGAAPAPLDRLEHRLQPWVAGLVVPVFGFANAGIALSAIGPASWLTPLPLGLATGLFVGKQAGIFLSIRLAVALGLARRPAGAGWTQIWGMALLCGIGFTMSLFIGGLAFADPVLVDLVKIGVFAGSLLSALAGYLVLRLCRAVPPMR